MTKAGSSTPGTGEADAGAAEMVVDAGAADLTADAERIAESLDALAERTRHLGRRFAHLGSADRAAVDLAAEIINDLTQGVGSLGPLQWTLIRDAGEYDRQRRTEQSAPGASKNGNAGS